jgi:signal transduction histidine kinase
VALAFANTLLLEDIGRKAVREERARLARELHDEIGPSLASLGLALDSALLRYPLEPELGVHLEELRGSVTALVEDVRSAVADLRARRPTSLVEYLDELVAARESGEPDIVVDIVESALPRPSIAEQLVAIITEALRNAIHHSGAGVIEVVGRTDRDGGLIRVADDGRGFDVAAVPDGHYGLIGMRERARAAGLRLRIDSRPGAGTSVTVSWGTRS